MGPSNQAPTLLSVSFDASPASFAGQENEEGSVRSSLTTQGLVWRYTVHVTKHVNKYLVLNGLAVLSWRLLHQFYPRGSAMRVVARLPLAMSMLLVLIPAYISLHRRILRLLLGRAKVWYFIIASCMGKCVLFLTDAHGHTEEVASYSYSHSYGLYSYGLSSYGRYSYGVPRRYQAGYSRSLQLQRTFSCRCLTACHRNFT